MSAATGIAALTLATPPGRLRAGAAAGASGGVVVELAGPRGSRRRVGTAAQALRDARLSASERAAVRSLVRAVELLRARVGYAGIDDAGGAVTLVLREPDATQNGPWAEPGTISVGSRNALAGSAPGRARRNVLLPVDVALHELVHVVQFARLASGAKPNAALLEGIADAAAMLATGDDLLGEGYYATDAGKRVVMAIRDLDPSGGRRVRSVLGPTLDTLDRASLPDTDEHDAGGVLSTIFVRLRASVGRSVAERLLWALIRDETTWRSGGSWRSVAAGLRAAAANDPAAPRVAVDDAIRRAGLDSPLAAAA